MGLDQLWAIKANYWAVEQFPLWFPGA